MRFLSLALSLLLGSVSVLAGAAHATLIDNGDGTITDTDSNLMWLEDANYAQTSGYDSDGIMTWYDATAWAENLSYAGYEDWRLPVALNTDGSGPCSGNFCFDSEMMDLWDLEIRAPQPFPFVNVQSHVYWLGTDADPPWRAWVFDFRPDQPRQATYPKSVEQVYAWAVRSVPEPSTPLLLAAGLAGLAAVRRRRA